MISVEHVKIGKEVEQAKDYFTLKGIFNTITDLDLSNGNINCFIVTAIKATNDEINKKKHLISQIIVDHDGKREALTFNEEDYDIKSDTALVFNMSPLPLKGLGVYSYRLIEKDGEKETTLHFAPLFSVVSTPITISEQKKVYAQ